MQNKNGGLSYGEKYRGCRAILLVLMIFTAANAMLALLESEWYMILGPALPYYLLLCGLIWGNRYSDAFYTDQDGNSFSFDVVEADGLVIAGLAVTVVFVILFLVLWLLSKKRIVPMIVAASLYGADVIFLAIWSCFVFDLKRALLYAALHIVVLAMLIVGCVWGYRMNKEESAVLEVNEENENLIYKDE